MRRRVIDDSSSESEEENSKYVAEKKPAAKPTKKPEVKPTKKPEAKSAKKTTKATEARKKKVESDDDSFIVDDVSGDSEDDYSDDTPPPTPKPKKTSKPTKKHEAKPTSKSKTTPKKKKEEDESENENDEEIGATKGSKRWNTLIHNGPLFPPEYVPHGVPLVYNGNAINLPPEIEEVATFYARYLQTDHVKNKVFNKNFFKDFRNYMKETKNTKLYNLIKDFELCDFSRIHAHLMEESERRKIKTKDEKAKEKELKEKERLKYGIAKVNGVEQRIGNYTIEPPGLFLGRGTHPKTGMLKRRVTPEMITINVSKGHVPKCPIPGHNWGKVVCDDHVTWLAGWHENILGRNKYVWLHATSSIKGASDQHKYEVARKLKDKIAGIRKSYTKDLSSSDLFERQRATALWLIDNLALRVGGEKGEDEADTVGCCSLRVEHVAFPKDRPNVVCFDFLGKDSMRFQKDVEAPAAIYKNLKSFASKPKHKDAELFDKLSTTSLNEYLKTFMNGLTAKVFRTYNASFTLQEELRKTPNGFEDMSVNDKVYFYNCANKQVAILCNHQKTVKQSVFSAAIGGLKELLIELVKQKKLVAAQIKKLGGTVPRDVRAPPKKKRAKKSDDSDEDDFESDDEDEGKTKKRKTPASKKGAKTKGKSKKDKQEEEEEEDDEDEEFKALINIDENTIREDDPDIIEYRKSKEEKLKVKANRNKLIQEKEEKEMKLKSKVKKEEEDDDSDVEFEDIESNVKDEPLDSDDDVEMSKSKRKTKANIKVKKEEVSDDESDSDSDKKKRKKKADKKVKEEIEEKPAKKVKKEPKEDDGFVMPTTLSGCESKYKKILEKIEKTKAKMVEKGELRNVALGTSKINYMDPRITIAWCKKVGVPLERVFQKTLREKFTWALDVEKDFVW